MSAPGKRRRRRADRYHEQRRHWSKVDARRACKRGKLYATRADAVCAASGVARATGRTVVVYVCDDCRGIHMSRRADEMGKALAVVRPEP